MSKTGISPLWVGISQSMLGNSEGIHCQWCKHIVSDEGESHCKKEGCALNNGNRIRTFDGEEIAKDCQHFELDEHYKSDDKYRKTFNQ